MRSVIAFAAVVALVVVAACHGDEQLAPVHTGHADRNPDVPPALFANYTEVVLPGDGIASDVNDNGDVTGDLGSDGILWSGPSHARTELPIFASAIANDGTVAGQQHGHAATWKSGNVVVLDTAPSLALNICRCGSSTVVGGAELNGLVHAVIWTEGIRIDAGMPAGSVGASFTSIANGFIVGNATVPTLDPATGITQNTNQAYSWTHAAGWRKLSPPGTLTSDVESVNRYGTSVGLELDPLAPLVIGVSYDSAAARTPLFGDPSFLEAIIPRSVNDAGTMAGNDPIHSPGPLALVISGGKALVLPPGDPRDFAENINASGVIAGISDNKPVIWVPNP